MYSSILVPLDGSGFSGQILPYVRLLAGASRCAVELLHIRNGAARPPFTLGAQPIDAYLKEVAAKYLTGDVRITILEGDPAAGDLIGRDDLNLRMDPVLGAVVDHLLGFLHATDQ